jgi:predicted nucleic acid-binding protein
MSIIVIDTSAIIAVLLNEPEKKRLIKATTGADLVAPAALNWEIGNAFTAMLKRKRIQLGEAIKAIHQYRRIPLRLVDIDIEEALKLSYNQNIHAYDAYFIICARIQRAPLLTIDIPLRQKALSIGAQIMEW